MATEVKRYRPRTESFRFDKQAIFNRVEKFYEDDKEDRDVDLEQRLQRYAKYRMWTSGGTGGPWPDSSDVALSDLTEKSMRLQDTLHNAVLAQRPAVIAEAVHQSNRGQEDVVSNLLDYQFFEEAPGETIIGEAAEKFINDGVYTLFIPWVREQKKSRVVIVLPGIPPDQFPADYFIAILRERFGDETVLQIKAEGDREQPWDFRLRRQRETDAGDGELVEAEAKFYTRPDRRIDLLIEQMVTVFDGPLPRVMDYDDVFHPVRAANLQPPGPSNPGGATHVILRDYPTKDEIRRLAKSKFYDQLTREDLDELDGKSRSAAGDEEREQRQKDDLAGKEEDPQVDGARSHETLTRLICFDRYDIDGDGLDEDVIWWVILEMKRVVKAKVLDEMYPNLPPNHPRPLAEAALFPVAGRRVGMSMLELLEGLHDTAKTLIDQTIDGNSMSIVPFGFYRPTSSMQSETIRLAPGELYPLTDPSRDVAIPQIGNPQAMGMALNLMTIIQQMGERVSVIGDLQLGRVPAGKSAALRTTSNMSLLAGQGEARPERILRRFFMGLCEAFSVMHSMNQYFLPKAKQIRIVGMQKPGGDPYMSIDGAMIAGRYRFKFKANALNTSKTQLQQTLQTMISLYVNALAIQLGVTTPETIYNLFRDLGKAMGADPEGQRYLNPPSPDLMGPRFLAEDALQMLLQGQMPEGGPMEPGGWAEHVQKLQMLMQAMDADEGLRLEVPDITKQMMQDYVLRASQRAQEQMQQQQLLANAQAFAQAQGGGGGGQGGRPPENVQAPGGNPPVSGGGELIDETMPTAGGGAQP